LEVEMDGHDLQLMGFVITMITLIVSFISFAMWDNLDDEYKVWAIVVLGVWCTAISILGMVFLPFFRI
jgi:hypothetical protein